MASVLTCSTNLETSECFDYCMNNTNQCQEILKNYCFNADSSNPFTAKIFTSESCNLLTQNIMSITPNTQLLDSAMNNFCVGVLRVNGENLEDYTQGKDAMINQKIKNLCGCHLSPEIYMNYYNSLVERYPSIASKNIHPKCLFTPCGYGNSYKTPDIKRAQMYTTICPAVNCVNYIKITGSGTIDTLNIIQNGSCFNYVSEIENCNTDTDCESNRSCINNVCTSPENVGLSCINDGNCEQGNKCYNNTCRPNNYCENNIDCGIESKCYKNTCSPIEICESDKDCLLNYICKDGKCMNPQESRNKAIIPIGIGVLALILVIIIAVSIFVFQSK